MSARAHAPQPAAALLSDIEEEMPRLLDEFEDDVDPAGQQQQEEEDEGDEEEGDEDDDQDGDMMSYFQDLPQLLVNEAGLPLADVLTDISASVAGIHEELSRMNKVLVHMVKKRIV